MTTLPVLYPVKQAWICGFDHITRCYDYHNIRFFAWLLRASGAGGLACGCVCGVCFCSRSMLGIHVVMVC